MLKLNDIYFGKTDAKNEVLSDTPDEATRFLNAFVIPPSLSVAKFLSKDKYYVVGLKGTGKTALLRYVSLKAQENEPSSVSSFVLFKTDVDEDLRKDFSKAARVQFVDESIENYESDDFETVWRWFIYRKIAASIQHDLAQPFQSNRNLAAFLALVSSEALSKPEHVGLMRLVPIIRKGNIEISKDPKLGLEMDWDQNGKAKINFNDLVRQADQAFEQLEPDVKRLNIFFDELELNYSSTKRLQRDARLVRDLIVSIERINSIAKKKGYPLCLYAAIRSEVLSSVASLGKEINKPIADFGSPILWNRPGFDASQQPLLTIIEQRINSGRIAGGLNALSSEDLWRQYFPHQIHNQKPQVYILHGSWYRPRDIVRLLISIQDQYPDEQSFTVQSFEAVRKSYSTASWIEITEELKAKYKHNEIDGIKHVFYGYKHIASLEEITSRVAVTAENHQETKQLMGSHSIKEILKDLFRIGAIGNIDRRRDRIRFSFRGDDEIIFDEEIYVHNALKAHLSI